LSSWGCCHKKEIGGKNLQKKWGNFSSGVIGIREIHNKKKRGKNKEEELKFNF
jgi:hypothetical protein